MIEGEFDGLAETLSESSMSFLLSGGGDTEGVLTLMRESQHSSMVDQNGQHIATVGALYNGVSPPQIWLLISDKAERSQDEDLLADIIAELAIFSSRMIEDYNVATTVYPANDIIRRTVFKELGFKEIASFHASFVDASIPTPQQVMAILAFDQPSEDPRHAD